MRKKLFLFLCLVFSFNVNAQIAPTASDDSDTTPEEAPITIDVLFNDTSNFGLDSSSVNNVTFPYFGMITIDTLTGEISYTPNVDYYGVDSFQYSVCDNGIPVLCDTAWVFISILNINDAPVAPDVTISVLEDSSVTICPAFSDIDGINEIIVAIDCGSTQGTASLNVSGCIDYTAPTNFVGTDEICYVVCDSLGLCDTGIIYINVTSVTDSIIITAIEDSIVSFCLDSIVNLGGTPTVSLCGAPNNGTLSLPGLPNGSCISYTPNTNFSGNDNFCVISCVGTICDTCYFTMVVTSLNDHPIAIDDFETTDEDTPIVIDVLANDSDLDTTLNPASVAVLNPTSNGTLSVDPITGEITYTPDPNFTGTDTFTYVVCDFGIPLPSLCDTAQVVINIDFINDIPTILQNPILIPEDSAIVFCPSIYDIEDPNSLLTSGISTSPLNGTLVSGVPSGCFNYTPNSNFNGLETFCLYVCDTNGACDTVCTSIEVVALDDAPIAVDEIVSTSEDLPLFIDVLANDIEVDTTFDTASVYVLVPVNFGTLSIDPLTAIYTYTPNLNFSGTDAFTYVVCDLGLPSLCDTAEVFINVSAINDAPTIFQVPVVVPEDSIIEICPVVDDVDDFNSILIVSVCGLPAYGTVVPTTPGCFIYSPDLNFNGFDTICLSVCDDDLLCETINIVCFTGSVNDSPIAIDDYETTDQNVDVVVDILSNDSDIDTILDPSSVSVIDPPVNGTVAVDPVTGECSYSPSSGFYGIDSFVYTICDFGLPMPVLCDTAYVFINVISSFNIAPVAVTDSVFTDSATLVNIQVLNNDIDNPILDLTNCVVTIINNPTNGNIVSFFTNDVNYEPNFGFTGFDSFTYSVCDSGLLCDTATVFVEVQVPGVTLLISASVNYINPCSSYSCNNEIVINGSGGVAPYTYSINGLSYFTSNTFTNLCPNNYIVFVKDAMNDIVSSSITIDYQYFNINASVFSAPCASMSSSGSFVSVNIYGGVGPFSYQWSNGSDSSHVLDPTEGVYHVLVTDSSTGCTRSSTINFVENGCFNISGNIYKDINGNCLIDSNDIDYNYCNVKLTNTLNNVERYSYAYSSGNYNFNVPAGNYEIELIFYGYASGIYEITCPVAPFLVNVDSLNVSDTVDFYISPINNIDLKVNYFLHTIRPGFSFYNRILYYNDGANTMSGTVVLDYDSLLTPSFPNTAVVDVVNRTMTWSFTNLTHGQVVQIQPEFDNLDVTIPLGTQICNTVTINPVSGDATPLNNVYNYCRTVVGSFDPNQKLVYPDGDILEEVKTHDYHIDFQNLGTYEATFVIIRDDLDDNLDISTLRDVSASHNFVLTVENEDELVFTFDNIHLAAEQDDEAGSKGHIDFTIDQKDDLPVGTEIENTADIYFDFNEAIITNTTKNTIVVPFGINDLTEGSIKLFPNPTQALVNVESEFKIKSIEVYNAIGEKVFETINMNNSSALLNLEKLSKGIYNIRIQTENGSLNKKVVVKEK